MVHEQRFFNDGLINGGIGGSPYDLNGFGKHDGYRGHVDSLIREKTYFPAKGSLTNGPEMG